VPHFTLQFQASGPQLQLFVGTSGPRQQALQQAGQTVPQPQLIIGLVDTGASTTAIDPGVIQALGVQPTGSMAILTPSTGATPAQANTYDVALVIPLGASGMTFTIPAIQIFEAALSIQGIKALIGRDVLSNSLLVYDGRSNLFSFAF
jgi:predicted aspartyl protease